MSGEGIHPAVQAAKAQLARGREKLCRQHAAGSPGVQVCRAMSDMLDEVVANLWQTAVDESNAGTREAILPRVALVAHSGFGRHEMAPFSDVDVMLLHNFHTDQAVNTFSRRFSQFLYDTGMDIGYSVRPLGQIASLLTTDATIFTSLAEGRLLCGNEQLFHKFESILRRQCRSHLDRLFYLVEQSRREERGKYGETVYLLHPNLKRSRGGLRDIQLLRWIGFLRYGMRSPDELAEAGFLLPDDAMRLRDSREFLLQLRNELHFHAKFFPRGWFASGGTIHAGVF
jgi:[protein-PII] uridylyltransferase